MKKRSICFLAVLLACLCVFVGCGGARYHAKLYDRAQDWVDEEFLNENRVYGAYYRIKDYGDGIYDYEQDKTSPRTRTFVIKTEEEYQQIFSRSTVEVDFEKQIVILYMFNCDYARDCLLKNIKLEGQKLQVYYKLENIGGRNDGTMPYQRCFMLVMDKTDFEAVEFIEK